MIVNEKLVVKTKSGIDIVNITDELRKLVARYEIKNGIMNVFVMGTTAAIIINEDEIHLREDFKKIFEDLVPKDRLYFHPENAYSHLRSLMLSPEKTIPIRDGKLSLGQWQSVMLIEFGKRKREREIIVTLIGE